MDYILNSNPFLTLTADQTQNCTLKLLLSRTIECSASLRNEQTVEQRSGHSKTDIPNVCLSLPSCVYFPVHKIVYHTN